MQVTVDGQTLFGQDYRYDAASNITEIIDKVNNQVKTYQYDQKNQLTMATTPGTFLESEATPGNVGYRAGDYLGTGVLDFGVSPQAVVSLDYHSSSIGLDFGTTAPGVKKIVLTPDAAHSTHRIEAYTLDLYVSADNLLYTSVPREGWAFVKEADGTVTITLKERLATRYLKIHVLFDDRDQDFNPVNKATFLNQLAATLQVYQEGDTRTEEYEYDAEGNRTFARLQLVRTLQYYYEYYPNSNRLKSDGKYEYTYDANGNLVAKEKIRRNPSEPEEKWEYTYDLLNRLVKVVKNGSVVAEYGYDPEGYRVVKKARGETTHYVFEGTEPIFEKRIFAEGRTAVRSYVYVLGRHLARVDGVIGDPEAPVYFYHTDHLGSLRAMTDWAGEVVWSADYFAFGTRYGTSEGPGFEEWHGFTGKEYDPDTGLYYFNARWYDQSIGRFISEDPIKDGLNWYTYAANNPLRFVDPSGLSEEPAALQFSPEQGGTFWDAARFVLQNSERPGTWLADQVEENPRLVKELAEAIQKDFKARGIDGLKYGETYELCDAGYYIPRLSLNNNVIKDSNASGDVKQFKIEQRFLTNKSVYGTKRDTKDIKAIVLHQTYSSTADSAISWFNKGYGSSQYIIEKDGTIIQLLPDEYSGFHIRPGHEKTWVTNLNSIGIEFVGMAYGPEGKEVYEDVTLEQQAAGKWLMMYLMEKHNISRKNIFRHPEVQAKNETEAQSIEKP